MLMNSTIPSENNIVDTSKALPSQVVQYDKSANRQSESESREEMPKFFITQNELAELFKISPQAAHMWMKSNQIESFKFKNKTALAPSEVRKFMEKRGITYPRLTLAFQMLKGGST